MCFKKESFSALILKTFIFSTLLILKNRLLSYCKLASSILILPLTILFVGIENVVLASLLLMATDVFAINRLSLYNETGKFSMGVPECFNCTVSSKFEAVVFEI